jgi:hypothetical protein
MEEVRGKSVDGRQSTPTLRAWREGEKEEGWVEGMLWLQSTHPGLNRPTNEAAVQTQSKIGDQPGSHFRMLKCEGERARATGNLLTLWLTRADGKSGGECQGVRPRI